MKRALGPMIILGAVVALASASGTGCTKPEKGAIKPTATTPAPTAMPQPVGMPGMGGVEKKDKEPDKGKDKK